MGKLSAGILGPMTGKVGGIVGSSWKGINTVKAHQPNVANPRTTAQVTQRTKFASAVAMASSLLTTIVKPLNDRFAVRQSGYNLVVSRNTDFFAPDGTLPAPENLIFSQGELGETEVVSSTGAIGSGDVTVTWATGISGKQLSTDRAYIAVFNTTRGSFVGFADVASRADGTATISTGDLSVASAGRIYLMFRSADGSKVGNTAYSPVTT